MKLLNSSLGDLFGVFFQSCLYCFSNNRRNEIVINKSAVYKLIMLERLFATAAWLTLAFIAYATLSPIGLRPEVTNPDIERFGAYAVAGFLFVMAYPRRTILVLAIVIGAAVVLEALQLLTPDRHGKFANLVVKASGGGMGVMSAAFIFFLVRNKSEKSV